MEMNMIRNDTSRSERVHTIDAPLAKSNEAAFARSAVAPDRYTKRRGHKAGGGLSLAKAFTYVNLGLAGLAGFAPSATACRPGDSMVGMRDIKEDVVYPRRQGPLWWDDCGDARLKERELGLQALDRCRLKAFHDAPIMGAAYGECATPRMVSCGEGPANIWTGFLVRQVFCRPN